MDPVGLAPPATRDKPVPGVRPADVARVRHAAREFEAIFLNHMLKTMRQASAHGQIPLSGTGQKLYRELMDDELAKSIARSGGVGLADILVRDLLRLGPAPKKASSSPVPPPIVGPWGAEHQKETPGERQSD